MSNWRQKTWLKIVALAIAGVFLFSEVTWAARLDFSETQIPQANLGDFLWQIYQGISSFLLPSALAEEPLQNQQENKIMPVLDPNSYRDWQKPAEAVKDTVNDTVKPANNDPIIPETQGKQPVSQTQPESSQGQTAPVRTPALPQAQDSQQNTPVLPISNSETANNQNNTQTGSTKAETQTLTQNGYMPELYNHGPPLTYNCAFYSLSELLPQVDSSILAKDLTPYTQADGQTSLYGIQQVALKYGLNLYGVKLNYQELTQLNGSAIVHFNLGNGQGHYVAVVTQATPDSISYIDNGTLKTLSRQEFETLWTGYSLIKEAGIGQALSAEEMQEIWGSGVIENSDGSQTIDWGNGHTTTVSAEGSITSDTYSGSSGNSGSASNGSSGNSGSGTTTVQTSEGKTVAVGPSGAVWSYDPNTDKWSVFGASLPPELNTLPASEAKAAAEKVAEKASANGDQATVERANSAAKAAAAAQVAATPPAAPPPANPPVTPPPSGPIVVGGGGGGGGGWYAPAPRTPAHPLPVPPTPVIPPTPPAQPLFNKIPEAILEDNLELSWTAQDAQSYTLEVSTGPDFLPANTTAFSGLTEPKKKLENLDKAQTYYVRVKASKNGLESPWSETESFKINPLPENLLALIKNNSFLQIQTSDNTTINYKDGLLNVITTAAGKTAQYSYKLDSNGALLETTIQSQDILRTYAQGNLIRISTKNGIEAIVQNSQLANIKTDNGYSLEYNSAGALAAFTSADGTKVENPLFNSEGALISGRITLTDGRKFLYADGLLKNVTTPDGSSYAYTYEKDKDNKEVLIVTDTVSHKIYRYKDGLLISAIEADGTLSEYFYQDGKLTQLIQSKEGAVTARYEYSYDGDLVGIKDSEGTIKIYDASRKLVKLIAPDGKEFAYDDILDSQGNKIGTKVRLVKEQRKDGSLVEYGSLKSVVLPDGTKISGVEFDKKGNLLSLSIGLTDGTTKRLTNNELWQIIRPDGTVISYQNGILGSISVNGSAVLATLERDEDNTKLSINGNTIYFRLGMLEKIDSANGDKISYFYDKDAQGNLVIQKVVVNKSDGSILAFHGNGLIMRQINSTQTKDLLYHYQKDALGNLEGIKLIQTEYKTIDGEIAPARFSVESRGFEAGYNYSIMVNDVAYGKYNQITPWMSASGYYAVTVSQYIGEVLETAYFNTWNDRGDTSGAMALANYINQIPAGRYALMAISDEGSWNMTEEAYQAIESLGSSQIRNVGFRDSWAMIGKKGAPKGSAIEELKPRFSGPARVNNYTDVEIGYYDGQGNPISLSGTGMGLPTSWRSQRPTSASKVTETLARNIYGEASAYFKNFNAGYPDSGFVRIWDTEDILTSDNYLEDLYRMAKSANKRAVYYDPRYPTNWTKDYESRDLRDYLSYKGFQVLDADALADWMKFNSADSVVVFSQDVAPDTVVRKEDLSNGLIRQYMERGGRVAWLKDVPFFYLGSSDGTKFQLGLEGEKKILGTTGGSYNLNDYVSSSGIASHRELAGKLSLPRPESFWLKPDLLLANYRTSFEADPDNDPHILLVKKLASETTSTNEYDADGKLLRAVSPDGRVINYKEGKIEEIKTSDGSLLVDYIYDSQGNLLRIEMTDSRANLPLEMAEAKKRLEKRRANAFTKLAQDEAGILQEMSKLSTAKKDIQNEQNRLINQRNDIASQDVHGKKAKKKKNEVVDAYDREIQKLQEYLAEINLKEQDAQYNFNYVHNLRVKVIEEEHQLSLEALGKSEESLWQDILHSEVAPLAVHWYRKALGRDPSQAEIEYWIEQAEIGAERKIPDYTIRDYLLKQNEFSQRTQEKSAIISEVESFLNKYLAATEAERTALLSSLGLAPADAIPLTAEEVNKIIAYLTSSSLHFANSAYDSLKRFLGKGVSKELAQQTILIDILSGVLTFQREGDLELSLYSLVKAAALANTPTYAVKLAFNELSSYLSRQPEQKLLTLINGNHYVVLEKISQEEVTYFDSGIGPNGESVSLSVNDFLEAWDGYILGKDKPQGSATLLTQSVLKQIKGGFFPFLIPLFIWLFSTIGSFISIAVSVVSTIISGVFSLVSGIISGISSLFTGIGGFLSNIHLFGINFIGKGLTLLGKGIGFLGSKLVGFGKSLISSFTNPLTLLKEGKFAQLALNTIKDVGVNLAVSKGVEQLNLDPRVGNVLSAVIAGGVTGGMSGGIKGAITEATQYGTIAGVRELGNKIGLDPTLTSLAGFAAGTYIGGALDPKLTGLQALKESLPALTYHATFGGIQRLGEELGLDPRISYLAGIPLGGAVSGFLNKAKPDAIWSSINEGLIKGVTSVGLEYAWQSADMDPFMGSLISRAVSGAIEGVLIKTNPVENAVKSVFQSGVDTLSLGGVVTPPDPNDPLYKEYPNLYNKALTNYYFQQSVYISKVIDFSQIIQEKGIGNALETYATGIFHQDTIQSIWQLGGIYDLVTNNAKVTHNPDKQMQVKRVYTNKEQTDFFDLSLENNDVVAIKQGNVYMQCKYVVGPDGEPILKDGNITLKNDDGSVKLTQAIKDFKLVSAESNLYDNVSAEDRAKIKADYHLTDEDLKTTKVKYEQGQNGQTNLTIGATSDPFQTLSDSLRQLIDAFKIEPGTVTIDTRPDPVKLRQLQDEQERLRNATLGLGYKTQAELKSEWQKSIDTIMTKGKKGDILIVASDDLTGFSIRNASIASVNHATFLDVDDDGTRWVIEINNPAGPKRIRFEDWAKNYIVIIDGRPTYLVDGKPAGEVALEWLKSEKGYDYNQKTNTFKTQIPYNWPGLVGINNNDPNTKICSELVHDAFKAINKNKAMPGVTTDKEKLWLSRVSPGNLLGAMPKWGKDLQEIIKEENP